MTLSAPSLHLHLNSSVRLDIFTLTFAPRRTEIYPRNIVMASARGGALQVKNSDAGQKPGEHTIKRKASITGLFEKTERAPLKRGKGGGKDPTAKVHDGSFLSAVQPKAAIDNEIYRRFAGMANTRVGAYYRLIVSVEAEVGYVEVASVSQMEQIEECCEALVARVNGQNVDGEPLHVDGVPTKADWEVLDAEAAALDRPFQEEKLSINVIKREDGQTTTKTITIADTALAYNKRLATWKAARDVLHKKREEVENAVDAAWDDYENDGDGAIKEATARHVVAMNGFATKSNEIHDQALAEIKVAQKEDREDAAAYDKRFQELLQLMAR